MSTTGCFLYFLPPAAAPALCPCDAVLLPLTAAAPSCDARHMMKNRLVRDPWTEKSSTSTCLLLRLSSTWLAKYCLASLLSFLGTLCGILGCQLELEVPDITPVACPQLPRTHFSSQPPLQSPARYPPWRSRVPSSWLLALSVGDETRPAKGQKELSSW